MGPGAHRSWRTIDLQPPTVAEITRSTEESGPRTNAAVERDRAGQPDLSPGPVHRLHGVDLQRRDVLVNRAQIKVGATWRDLNLDPSIAPGAANDGNADGFPGSKLLRRGRRLARRPGERSRTTTATAWSTSRQRRLPAKVSTSPTSQVYAASIDSTPATPPRRTGRPALQNDYRDNDNDAFFVYDSYANGGLVGGATGIGEDHLVQHRRVDDEQLRRRQRRYRRRGATKRSRASATAPAPTTTTKTESSTARRSRCRSTASNRLGGDERPRPATSCDAHGFGAAGLDLGRRAHIFGTRPHAGTDPGAQYRQVLLQQHGVHRAGARRRSRS